MTLHQPWINKVLGVSVWQNSTSSSGDRAALSSPRPGATVPPARSSETAAARQRLGVEGISKLRIGKSVEMEVEAPDEAEARRRLELLAISCWPIL